MEDSTWKHMERQMKQNGFRIGALEGKSNGHQIGFDAGYSTGFKTGKILGTLLGLQSVGDKTANVLTDLELGGHDSFSSKSCVLCQKNGTSFINVVEEQKKFFKTLEHEMLKYIEI